MLIGGEEYRFHFGFLAKVSIHSFVSKCGTLRTIFFAKVSTNFFVPKCCAEKSMSTCKHKHRDPDYHIGEGISLQQKETMHETHKLH